jgi:iron-sulfur cluster repair protein YtfE (RIC family)
MHPKPKIPESNLSDYFGQDHEQLHNLLNQFERLKQTDPAAARERFTEFKAGLERHIGWEEQIVFPIYEAKFALRDAGPTAAMRWEHRRIQNALNEIQALLEQRQTVDDIAILILRNLLQQHNLKEEDILYPALDALLDRPERDQVFLAMGRT